MATAEGEKKKKAGRHAPRNHVLANGIMRFSRAQMSRKAGRYLKKKCTPKVKKTRRLIYATKQIGGDNNGKERKVRKVRRPKYYPTEDVPKKLKSNKKKPFSSHKRNLRKSIKPGTVLIILCGTHKGKRVVFLKQLSSGLLLVTGPYKVNRCPLRRLHQKYVIATSTRVNLQNVSVPKNLTDDYFKRKRLRKPKHQEGEIFDTKEEKYEVSEQRKADQVTVDKQVIAALKKQKQMIDYLRRKFALQNKQYPHLMKF